LATLRAAFIVAQNFEYKEHDKMRHVFKAWALATMTALAVLSLGGAASAQDMIKQIKLSEPHVKGFITAQGDMAKISEKMQAATSEKPDPKIQAELEDIAKKNGFKDFAEYDDVAANISMVMAGIDPQSGAYTDPLASIKREIEEVTADKTLQDKDKKQMLEELTDALKTTQPVQFPENVDLIKKYRAEIDKVLQ
jgi:hypothetical protein